MFTALVLVVLHSVRVLYVVCDFQSMTPCFTQSEARSPCFMLTDQSAQFHHFTTKCWAQLQSSWKRVNVLTCQCLNDKMLGPAAKFVEACQCLNGGKLKRVTKLSQMKSTSLLEENQSA